MSPDQRIYAFTLRSDVQWTDGVPVTAEHVPYGILRTLAPETESVYAYTLYVIENGQECNQEIVTHESLVGITAVSTTTLRITVNHPAS